MEMITQYKAIIIPIWFSLFFFWERLYPHFHSILQRQKTRVARNISLWLINTILSIAAILPLTALATECTLNWKPDNWMGQGGIILDLLIIDCWIYLWHRANHKIPFLWRFHEVHHRDEALDTTTAVRFHFGEVMLSAIIRVPIIILLDIDITTILIFETALLMASIFHHSNAQLPKRFEAAISKICVTPSIHWVHHHAKRSATDSNYSAIFSFWDVIFKTRSKTQRFDTMKIGTQGRPEQDIKDLLKTPFIARHHDR